MRKEEVIQKVYNCIKRRGKISRTDLATSFSGYLTASDLNAILANLIQSGMVGSRSERAKGVRGRRFKTIYSPKEKYVTSEGSFRELRDTEEKDRDTLTGPRLHEKIKDCLYQIGKLFEKYPEKEYRKTPYIYDLIWCEYEGAPRASHVFEVQDKGNLIEALAKLQHARDIWGAKLFLVVVGERDRKKLPQLVGPLLEGTFHRLSRDLIVLTEEDAQGLYEDLNKRKELIRHFLR